LGSEDIARERLREEITEKIIMLTRMALAFRSFCGARVAPSMTALTIANSSW
jgi:hypothetical protein